MDAGPPDFSRSFSFQRTDISKSRAVLEAAKKFRFKNKLLSFDTTTISRCLSIFPWAKFRRAKGGVKVHVMLDHDQYMPSFVYISSAKKHDVTVARALTLNPGSIVAMDRAYNDYAMFARWTERGVFFVTRMKEIYRRKIWCVILVKLKMAWSGPILTAL